MSFKQHLFSFLAAVSFIPSCFSAEVWPLDRSHSSVEFSAEHLMISKINGRFNEFHAWFEIDKDNFEKSSLKISAQASSIDTGFEFRDKHLQNEEFFNSRSFPVMTFVSTHISPISSGEYRVEGNATIKDVTQKVTFKLKHNGYITDYWGNLRAGFHLSGVLNRNDFSLDWNDRLKEGGLVIGEEIAIECNLEVFQQTQGPKIISAS